jgi:hypothetical protein
MSDGNPYGENYQWPNDIYSEMRDMMTMSLLVYDFGFLVDACRKAMEEGKTITGLKVNSNYTIQKSDDAVLNRSFTPGEIKSLVQNNEEYLVQNGTFEKSYLGFLIGILDDMQGRADEFQDIERPLVIEEFDDQFQNQECVYGISRDSTNKRIVLVFRGTDMTLAPVSNWKSNLSIFKKEVEVPDVLKGKLSDDNLNLHSGFYDYLFSSTRRNASETKYDQILGDIKSLLAKHPDHKIYVTGHSLGGALSGLCAFYLACELDLPKPISCINYASPRFGGYKYYEGSQYLEKMKQLRMLRVVNDKDTVASAPSLGYYHGGFACTCEKDGWIFSAGAPTIEYRKMNSMWSKFRTDLSQSMFTSLNIGFDHGSRDYLERIMLAKSHLKKYKLNRMYQDEDWVGFKLDEDPSFTSL